MLEFRNCMIAGEQDQPLFMIVIAVLSEWMSMDFPDHSCHHRMAAMMIGYSLWSADEGQCDSGSGDLNSGGQAEANHFPV